MHNHLPRLGRVHHNQVNAHLSEEIEMRVGIPHRSGQLAAHAFNSDFKAMVSASAFWNREKRCFQFPEASDLHEIDFALDSAGFTALKLFQQKGAQPGLAGIFPWTLTQYLELAVFSGCSWFSAPDLCCEREVANTQDAVDYRVRATATLLEATLQAIAEWQAELVKTESADIVSNMLKPPVPALQGWSADDYLRSLDMMMEVWNRWEPWLAPPCLIGLGSVCRRDLHHPQHGLYAILRALEGRLPKGSRLHLFGVKTGDMSGMSPSMIASSDSMAWDVSARVKAFKSGTSNTFAKRKLEMSAWMDKANSRLAAVNRMAALS